MTVDAFWQIIEQAWVASPKLNKQRIYAIATNDNATLVDLSIALEEEVLETYTALLLQLDKAELTSFIHHLEERMYHIDREDIHEFTDGSDDGFLYCRCFIVGMGREYYEKVDQDPSKATMDLEAELFGFSAYGIYEEKFGEEFDRYQHHSMETCSNSGAWSF